MQDPVDEFLVGRLAEPFYEGERGQGDAHADGRQAVFGEAEVEHAGYEGGGCAELLLLFGQVGTADEADGDAVAEGGEEVEHFGRDGLVEVLIIG